MEIQYEQPATVEFLDLKLGETFYFQADVERRVHLKVEAEYAYSLTQQKLVSINKEEEVLPVKSKLIIYER